MRLIALILSLFLSIARDGVEPPPAAPTVRLVCLVVDLDGDGLRLGDRRRPVLFDADGDGERETVQWTAPAERDGFLWLDADADRALDPDELLGSRLATPDGPSRRGGWRSLADLDRPDAGGDGDGRFTPLDRAWSDVWLWIDSDHDGRAAGHELYRLEDWCIGALGLDFAEGLKVDGGLNLETAWATVGAGASSCAGTVGSAVVTEVHLPLLRDAA